MSNRLGIFGMGKSIEKHGKAEIFKPAQIRIRVSSADAEVIDILAGTVLSRNEIASALLGAAIQAVRENNCKLQMPPKFKVSD